MKSPGRASGQCQAEMLAVQAMQSLWGSPLAGHRCGVGELWRQVHGSRWESRVQGLRSRLQEAH